jgi:hypothetical protein
VKDTIGIMQHELDALVDEGYALFTGAMQGTRVYAPAYEPTSDDLTEFLHGVQLIRKRVR